jgi:probable rRNA maturation factor
MEESTEHLDQPPPTNITVQGDATEHLIWLEERASEALCFLQKDESDVSVLVVDDIEMSRLHQKHSGVDGTTDVLTFDHGSEAYSIRADIVICVDVATREAKHRGHTLENELLLYIVHGILHCCGFDDYDEESHQKMHAEEDRILSAIGVGTVWSSDK